MTEIKLSNVYAIQRPQGVEQGGEHNVAAQELLQNGILVETNKGLICMSLKDALNQGVGGLNLSEEDFKNVAAELLFQEEPCKVIAASTANNYGVLPKSDVDSFINVKPRSRTVLKSKFRSHDNTNVSFAVTDPSTSKVVGVKRLMNDLFENDEIDSVLVSDSGLSSDTSEVVSASNASTDSSPAKRRGGWPKGRKRKPEMKSETRQPKAPVTGYVIFLNEKRKDYKDLPFSQVTKILGNEWSRLSLQDKKKYLEQAEIDKKRYREELKAYRQSDAYRHYLQRKRIKRIQGHRTTEESDMDATDEIDEEESEELYCRSCDQWFQSLHNKKEHLYGRQHLASISARAKSEDFPTSTSQDESSLDGFGEDQETRSLSIPNMDDIMSRLVTSNAELERERKILREKLAEVKSRNKSLFTSLTEANRRMKHVTSELEVEKAAHNLLEQSLCNLLNVPAKF